MICDNCGQDTAHIRKVNKTFGKGKEMFIIQNIPVVHCKNCGESYLTAETLHEIERIKLHHKSFAITKPIGVVRFA